MEYLNIRQIIFEFSSPKYSYSVHLIITNIFIFGPGPEYDPKYFHVRILVNKNISNIFVFIFGQTKNIRYALLDRRTTSKMKMKSSRKTTSNRKMTSNMNTT